MKPIQLSIHDGKSRRMLYAMVNDWTGPDAYEWAGAIELDKPADEVRALTVKLATEILEKALNA